jgi:putative spermidine/putrescine transport system permease protein
VTTRVGLWIGRLYALLIALFLVSPLVVVVVLSFSASEFIAFPPRGLSLRWYEQLMGDSTMLHALWFSAELAASATIIALLIAVPTAVLLIRHRFAGKTMLRGLALSPLIFPEVLLALALLVYIQAGLHIRPSVWTLTIGHILVIFPFALQLITSAMGDLGTELEEAARTLGATPLKAFWLIALPVMLPGIAAAGMFSFIFSFDNVAISLFLSVPGQVTLPVAMFEVANTTNDPSLASISTVLIATGLVLTVVFARLKVFDGVLNARH